MTLDTKVKRAAFRQLHESGTFALPNPWNIGSLRELEKIGFRAVATTGAGYAMSIGQVDQSLELDAMLKHTREICSATDLPVNADFEYGFADAPDVVTANVSKLIATGIAGLSIEDKRGDTLYDLTTATERIVAARHAIDKVDSNIMLVGRSEGFLIGNTDIGNTLDRLTAYADAGADVLYAPGVTNENDIRAITRAVAPKAVNVLLVSPAMNVSTLSTMGVRRVSTGAFLFVSARAGFCAAARLLAETGALPDLSFS